MGELKMNEVQPIKDFSVSFQPAEITIENYGELKETIKGIAEDFDSIVYDDIETMKEDRTKLNKLSKNLDDRRKEIKREFKKPLDNFEKDVKDMIALIDVPLEKMNTAIRGKEQEERDQRETWLNDYLEAQSDKFDVDVGLIEKDRSWTNKGLWTDKGNPRKQLKEKVTAEFNRVKEEKKLLIAHKKIIETACEKAELDSAGWVSQLDYKSVDEILDEITKHEEKEKLEEQKDTQLQENDEKEKSDEQVQVQPKEDGNKQKIEQANIFGEFEEIKEPELITNTIEVTGTLEQLNKLNDYLVRSGIKVKQVVHAIDDLPF